MTDCAIFNEELQDILSSITNDIEKIKNAKGSTRNDLTNSANDKVKKARQVLQKLRVEVRNVSSSAEQADYQSKVKAHEGAIASLSKQVTQLKDTSQHHEEPSSSGGPDRTAVRKKANEINAVQNNTLSELDRGIAIVSQTQSVADQAQSKLQEQTEVMKAALEDLRTLSGNVKRAQRELNAFMRRMMTDKLIMVLMALVLFGIIGLIVWRIVKMKQAS